MPDKALTSLAVLSTNYDAAKGKDYFDLFIPFFLDYVNKSTIQEISAHDAQSFIKEEFGFTIPISIIKIIIEKCISKGYLETKERAVYKTAKLIPDATLKSKITDTLRKYDKVIQDFKDYAKINFDITFTQDDAEAYFYSFVFEYLQPLLGLITQGTTNGIVPGYSADYEKEYIISKYICHISASSPDIYDYFIKLVKGSMLAMVLAFEKYHIRNLTRRPLRFKIYFDTPFLIKALGYEGDVVSQSSRELLALIKYHKIPMYCFTHTYQEISGVLDNAINTLKYPLREDKTYSPIVQYSIKNNVMPADLIIRAARLYDDIEELGLVIRDKPPYTEVLGIDEKALEYRIEDEIHYKSKKAREKDVISISAIYRLKQGFFAREFERARALFVTTNYNLIKGCDKYFAGEFGNDYVNSTPICFYDHVFASVIWLKKPELSLNLPDKFLAAECYAALNPSPALWDKYYETTNRLRAAGSLAEDDFKALRFSAGYSNLLMETTHGDPTALTDGSVFEIRDKVREAITRETEAKAKEFENKYLKATEQVIILEAEKAAAEVLKDRKYDNYALKFSIAMRIALNIVLFLIVLFLAYKAKPENFSTASWGSRIASIILALLSAISLVIGFFNKWLINRFEKSVKKLTKRTLLRIF
jgi:hypothetical protein